MIGEISILFGLKVYTDEGRYVGKVDDVLIDADQRLIRGLAVGNYNKAIIESKAPGVIIPYRLVKSVNDIVIIKDIFRYHREFKGRTKEYENEEDYEESEEYEEYVEGGYKEDADYIEEEKKI